MSLAVDHLVLCVTDLTRIADELRAKGLASIQGGRHQGHGTENRIVPLGDSYLELVAIIDPDEAAGSAFGRWVSQKARDSLAVDAVCLRSSDLDEVCLRLGLESTAMSRTRPDGVELRWRLAGMEEALTRSLPFFIEWEVPDEMLPGRSPITHPAGPSSLDRVVVAGDLEELESWAGEADQILRRAGDRTATSARLITSAGVITI